MVKAVFTFGPLGTGDPKQTIVDATDTSVASTPSPLDPQVRPEGFLGMANAVHPHSQPPTAAGLITIKWLWVIKRKTKTWRYKMSASILIKFVFHFFWSDQSRTDSVGIPCDKSLRTQPLLFLFLSYESFLEKYHVLPQQAWSLAYLCFVSWQIFYVCWKKEFFFIRNFTLIQFPGNDWPQKYMHYKTHGDFSFCAFGCRHFGSRLASQVIMKMHHLLFLSYTHRVLEFCGSKAISERDHCRSFEADRSLPRSREAPYFVMKIAHRRLWSLLETSKFERTFHLFFFFNTRTTATGAEDENMMMRWKWVKVPFGWQPEWQLLSHSSKSQFRNFTSAWVGVWLPGDVKGYHILWSFYQISNWRIESLVRVKILTCQASRTITSFRNRWRNRANNHPSLDDGWPSQTHYHFARRHKIETSRCVQKHWKIEERGTFLDNVSPSDGGWPPILVKKFHDIYMFFFFVGLQRNKTKIMAVKV